MTPALTIARPEGLIYRVARRPDPWAWPDWAYDAAYPDSVPAEVVPTEWLETRLFGTARHEGGFVDLGSSDSLAYLRAALADRVLHHGLDDLDAGAIRRAPRAFTQEISRLGDEFVNWAIFEPTVASETSSDAIDPDDEALLAVLVAPLCRTRTGDPFVTIVSSLERGSWLSTESLWGDCRRCLAR
jgi:hypothetical protein